MLDTLLSSRDRRVTLEHLRTFLAVVDDGGFVHASRKLGRTQSAVTQNLRKLEEIVGCTLLERRQGRVTGLTGEGERFLPQVREVLGRLSTAVEALQTAPMAGRIRLGIPDDFNAADVQTAVSCCREMNPDLRVEVRSSLSGTIRALAREGDLDVAFFRTTDGDDHVPGMRVTPLSSEALHWVGRSSTGFEEGTELPLVLFAEGCPFREAALRCLNAAGRIHYVAYTSSSIGNVHRAIAAGLGIGVLHSRLCDTGSVILGAESGFPQLPDVRLAVAVRPERTVYRDFADYLLRTLA